MDFGAVKKVFATATKEEASCPNRAEIISSLPMVKIGNFLCQYDRKRKGFFHQFWSTIEGTL